MRCETAVTLLRLLCAASFALLVVPPDIEAATMKLANGDTVEGEIQGRIVMKGAHEGNVVYRILEGRDITTIDESGVHGDGEFLLLVGTDGARPVDVLRGLLWWEEGRRIRNKHVLVREVRRGKVMGLRLRSLPAMSEELVGEYRLNHYAETAQLTGTVRIKTATGEVLTFPVSAIARPSS